MASNLVKSSSPSPGGGKLKTPLPPILSLRWTWTSRGGAKKTSRSGSARVVDNVAWVVIEAQDFRLADAIEDGDADFGGRQHVAVGLHADLEPEPGGVIAECRHVGEVSLAFFIGPGIAGEGVDDFHGKSGGNVEGAGEARRPSGGLQLSVAAQADRFEPEIGELPLDARDLRVGDGVGIDVLEPAFDRADLAGVVAGGGKSFERLVDRIGGENDRRTEYGALHRCDQYISSSQAMPL
jgi:hypothetical protein